jgi:hypothetical protein
MGQLYQPSSPQPSHHGRVSRSASLEPESFAMRMQRRKGANGRWVGEQAC